MKSEEEKIKALLTYTLWAIADATESMETESSDCGTLHSPVLRYFPVFSFSDEDIQLIKSLGEEMMEDFSTLTES